MFAKPLILFKYLKLSNCTRIQSASSFALKLVKIGNPLGSIEKQDFGTELLDRQLKDEEVLLQYMAAPINPADILYCQGLYGTRPKLPSFLGSEGVAKILKTGSSVNKLKVNDWVITKDLTFGSWTTHAVKPQSALVKVDNTIDLFAAAQLTINPPTAYRMMKDFVDLKPGDCLLQNGANSAVGLFVIQFAKEWGVKTVNVIRARSDPKDTEKLKAELMEYGADFVVTDQDLRQKEVMNEIWSKGAPKPKLALDCVGGKNATNCISHLDNKGVMVTYGVLSGEPLTIPVGQFLFKDLKFFSFWLYIWAQEQPHEKYEAMQKNIVSLIKQEKLKLPKVIPFDLNDFKKAFMMTAEPFSKGKIMFTMNN